MPFTVEQPEVLGAVGILPPRPEDSESPGIGETLGAALRQGNSLISAIASERTPLPGEVLPDFDATAGMTDQERDYYAPILRDLAGALTPEEAERAKRQYDMEAEDRATLERSGIGGTVALIGAGILDPINLLPVGGAAYRAARVGGGLTRQAVELGKIGLLSTAAQEGALQATQVSRPWQESAFNIAGGTVLAGLLGAGIAAWAKRDGTGLKAVADAVQRDIREAAELEGIMAFHGSRFAFDRFDIGRIGTGEGAQAYGYGLYFAENRGIARHYQVVLSKDAGRKGASEAEGEVIEGAVPGGALYEVKIAASRDDFLDWDKPLLKQSVNVKAALMKLDLIDGLGQLKGAEWAGPLDGQALYRLLGARHSAGEPPDVAASRALREAGIVGVKYLDASSREAGFGSQNLVVFDDKLVEITGRNGEKVKTPELSGAGAQGEGGSVGAAAVATPGIAAETLRSAAGLEKALGFTNPYLRVVQSPSVRTRQVAQELADSGGLEFQKNDLGLATALGGAVEIRARMWEAPLADSLMEMDRLFVAYRLGREKRLGDIQMLGAGDLLGSGGKLTRTQFYEAVGQAMRRGDTHQIPEVQQAAQYFRKSLFDPLKERAMQAGLLDEGVEVTTAASYMTRIYDRVKIKARRPEFTRILVRWLKGKNPEADEGELWLVADQIVDRILGTPDGRIPYDAVGDIQITVKQDGGGNLRGARGAALGRVLDIEDAAIEGFLESNIEALARSYVRTFGSDAEIAARFGDPMMTKAFQDVQADYARMVDKLEQKGRAKGWDQGKLDKRLRALAERKDADLRDLAAMRDRIRHRYKLPDEPDGIAATAGRIARTWNYLRLMGSAALSSLPEAFRTAMVHGFGRSFRQGLVPLISGLKTVKMAAKEVRLAGGALDMALDSRAMAMADLTDDFARGTKLERGMRVLQDRFGMVSLLAPWTAWTKQFGGLVTMSRILESATQWRAGRITQRDMRALAAGGIDEDLARRIAGEFERHGEMANGVWLPHTTEWGDREAVQAFRAALLRDVDRIITTPGAGDKPLWMSGELGKTLFQFKSFTMSATQRVLISGLQQRDAAFFSGAIAMVGMGMFRYALYLWAAEKALPDSWEQWVAEGVDRSGITGWLFEAHNGLEKVTGGVVGLNALTGGAPMSRYVSRSAVDSLLGPTFGAAKDAVDVIASASTGNWTPGSAAALRRMVPYQNLFYVRGLFDRLQAGISP